MKIHNEAQGSEEWKALRLKHFTASEAPAMMGESPYMSRDELLRMKKTGESKEITPALQRVFDEGHRTEAMARPIVEAEIGEELYPVTGSDIIDGLPLLASYDGLTMLHNTAFEHKQFNEKLAQAVRDEKLDLYYTIQLEQQLMVSGATEVLFVVSDGTEDNFESMFYHEDLELRKRILAGWTQFKEDLQDYEVVAETVKVEANAIMELPSLSIRVTGSVTDSNLDVYKTSALAFIESINTDLETDQDFADAEASIKICDSAEKALKAAKSNALGQTLDIDTMVKTIDHLGEMIRKTRLDLNKQVKIKKDKLKSDAVTRGQSAIREYIEREEALLNHRALPPCMPDFILAIKSKRTMDSINSAINDLIAKTKIEINENADIMRENLVTLDASPDHMFLFNDLQSIIHKEPADFKLLAESRINEHKAEEEKRLEKERERIQAEEQEKARKEEERKTQEKENARLAEEQASQEPTSEKTDNVPPVQEESQEQAEISDNQANEPISGDGRHDNGSVVSTDKSHVASGGEIPATIEEAVLLAIGWTFADCCVDLDEGRDPREKNVPEMLKRAMIDLDLN